MATPAEFLYESCSCESGMRDGLRCADCGGRGILPKGVKPTGETVEGAEGESLQTDDLNNLSMTDLRSLARDHGVSAGGGREALVARIRAAAEGEASPADEGESSSDDDGSTAEETPEA